MPQVRLSARAQTDITRLHHFLRASDVGAALRAVQAIRSALVPLSQAPGIGRPIDDHPGLRELVIGFGASGYLALYRFEPTLDAVTVLAVRHQKELDYQ
jgi:plasmid stabilization system protein ParE